MCVREESWQYLVALGVMRIYSIENAGFLGNRAHRTRAGATQMRDLTNLVYCQISRLADWGW